MKVIKDTKIQGEANGLNISGETHTRFESGFSLVQLHLTSDKAGRGTIMASNFQELDTLIETLKLASAELKKAHESNG